MGEFHVGFPIYAGITQLDFTGPFEVFSRLTTPGSLTSPSPLSSVKVHVAAKSLDPVQSDRGLVFVPSCTLADCPPLDLICVPGGAGIVEAIGDPETVEFVKRQGEGARYVSSVCVGAFLLGAAGLLKGRRATTHWAHLSLLPLVGAVPDESRVVQDGNVITAAGVSAGLDFAFAVAAEVAGSEVAKAIQLGIEYDPSPPFHAGHPRSASRAANELMVERNRNAREGIRAALAKAGTIEPR